MSNNYLNYVVLSEVTRPGKSVMVWYSNTNYLTVDSNWTPVSTYKVLLSVHKSVIFV